MASRDSGVRAAVSGVIGGRGRSVKWMPRGSCEFCAAVARVRLTWASWSELFGALFSEIRVCFSCAADWDPHGRDISWEVL